MLRQSESYREAEAGRTACLRHACGGVYAPAEFRLCRNVCPQDFVYKPGCFMQRRTAFCEKTAENG